jgi:hypothetical protein
MKQDNNNVPPQSCQDALLAIEADPLNLSPDILDHVSVCPMCSEVRVMWLAQEDFDAAAAPAGYFQRLPSRVLQKMPLPSSRLSLKIPILASAASLMLIASAGGFWFGRQTQPTTVVFEAVMPPRDMQDYFQDPSSFSSLELFSQIPDLTPEETAALMTDLKKPEADLQPSKIEGD